MDDIFFDTPKDAIFIILHSMILITFVYPMTRIDYPGPEYLIVSRRQSVLYHAPKNRTRKC